MTDKPQPTLFGDSAHPSAASQPVEPLPAQPPRFKPIDRRQLLFRPVDVEGLIGPEHPARAIWELSGRLDWSGFYLGCRAVEGQAGQSAHDPRLLACLWIYAYSQGISSARELSRLCRTEAGCQWLTGLREINHHSLSDFRVAHGAALPGLFTEVLGVLSAEGLVTLELVAHDGTKVKASAGADTYRREKTLREHLALARKQVERLSNESEEEGEARRRKARQRAARKREEQLASALAELEKIREKKSGAEAKAEARASETDPQSRIMKQSDGGFAPSYNVQLSTDSAAGIIVGVGVTQQGVDYEQLLSAVERIGENMGRAPEKMVVDEGYISRENVIGLAAAQVELIGSIADGSEQVEAQMRRRGVAEEFRPQAFRYDRERDVFLCPAGRELKRDGQEVCPGVIKQRYRARAEDCRACPHRERCCPKAESKSRSVSRAEEDERVVVFREKMQSEEAKALYRKRGQLAEFTNAWLKDKMKFRQFRLRGLVKVGLEMLWVCLAYNISRWCGRRRSAALVA